MGTVQEQRIKMDREVLRGTDGNGGTESGVSCQQCRQPLEDWEAGFCEGCGMSKFKPVIRCSCGCRLYTCPRCGGMNSAQLHRNIATCKRCGKTADDPVKFGRHEVYCMTCTCNECGDPLEGYEEITCNNCIDKFKDAPQ